MGWNFRKDGSFEWIGQPGVNEIYFPLCNEAGMMSNTTCRLGGDAKTGLNSFFSLPVTMEDLHNNRSTRNFWIYTPEQGAFSLTGVSAKQWAEQFEEDAGDAASVTREVIGDFLNYRLTVQDRRRGFKAEVLLFCPDTQDQVELMEVRYTNTSDQVQRITPTSGLPIFGRSADNLRDHRHCTSMMHRMKLYPGGLSVKPAIHHDERGHEPNHTYYFVVGAEGDGSLPMGQFPTVKEFIGDGGSFDWPYAVVKNMPPYPEPPCRRDGREAVGALRFADRELAPGETASYILISGVTDEEASIGGCLERYGTSARVQEALEANRQYWRGKSDGVRVIVADETFSQWLRWVGIQPMLRKIMGCSFLPYHDYGRGGRGWRDLWQDYLALILQDPRSARAQLTANYAGVRLDGSNATIILAGMGNFAADRNKVSRVWMDHGVWPFFTTNLYIEQSGDTDILWEEGPYWKDGQIRRAHRQDHTWTSASGNRQKDADGKEYLGSVMEHILLQHLICFHNVGAHNNIRLEDGDWNDQLDLAPDQGETIPFTAFYGMNLCKMADLLLFCHDRKGIEEIKIFKELLTLTNFDHLLDYEDPAGKLARLAQYFDRIENGFSGRQINVNVLLLSNDLQEKGNWLLNQVAANEWLTTASGSFLNGYYNNDGESVDGEKNDGIHMTLTAQAFGIMSGALSHAQAAEAHSAVLRVLSDPGHGGLRLITPLGTNTWNFGRGFALIYGEKETGGTFSHMVVMYANALYQRGLVREGYEVIKNLCHLCCDSDRSLIYPGVPEYISHEGIGKYHYVTGAASWMMLTVQTGMFGVYGRKGDLVLEPRLVKEQFVDGRAAIQFGFRGKRLTVEYWNSGALDYGSYQIDSVQIDGKTVDADAAKTEIYPMSDGTQAAGRVILPHALPAEGAVISVALVGID